MEKYDRKRTLTMMNQDQHIMSPGSQVEQDNDSEMSEESTHLSFRMVFLSMCAVGVALSVASIAGCTFLLMDQDVYNGDPSTRELGWHDGYYAFGAFSYEPDPANHYCVRYNRSTATEYFKATGKTARASGVLAAILSGLVLVLYISLELFWESKRSLVWHICRIFLAFAILCQLGTFLLLLMDLCQDTDKCTLGPTGYASMAACVVLFIAFILMVACVRPHKKPFLVFSEMNEAKRQLSRWILLGLSLVAFTFATTAVVDCTFLRKGENSASYSDAYFEAGLFRFNFDSFVSNGFRCVSWGDFNEAFDAYFRASKAFGVIDAGFSAFVVLQLTAVQLFLRRGAKVTWLTTRPTLLLALISQPMAFLVFRSDFCTMDWSSIFDDGNLTLSDLSSLGENATWGDVGENTTLSEEYALGRKSVCKLGPSGIVAALNCAILLAMAVLLWLLIPVPESPFLHVELSKNHEARSVPDEPTLSESQEFDPHFLPIEAYNTCHDERHSLPPAVCGHASPIASEYDLEHGVSPSGGSHSTRTKSHSIQGENREIEWHPSKSSNLKRQLDQLKIEKYHKTGSSSSKASSSHRSPTGSVREKHHAPHPNHHHNHESQHHPQQHQDLTSHFYGREQAPAPNKRHKQKHHFEDNRNSSSRIPIDPEAIQT